MGNLLMVVVGAANVQAYQAAREVLRRLTAHALTRLSKIWADAIYKGDKDLACLDPSDRPSPFS